MINCVKDKPRKLSKSDSGLPKFTKAQVFKNPVTGNWLAVCQEGCGFIKYKQSLPHRVVILTATEHMKKKHPGIYQSGRVHG